jgi:hypothetical protein
MDKIIEDQLKMMPLELDAPRNRTLCAEAWFDRSTRTGTHIETPSLRTKP